MGSRTLFSNGYGPEIQLSDPRDTLENVQKIRKGKPSLQICSFLKHFIRKVTLGEIVLKFLRQAIHVTTYIFKLRLNILISISLKK